MTTAENKDLKLEVFDPPMCCSSGVCGAEVDPTLVAFAASLQWLATNNVEVRRYNPLHQYEAFSANPAVTKAVNEKGLECLPLILLNGTIISSGVYPPRGELIDMLGLCHIREVAP